MTILVPDRPAFPTRMFTGLTIRQYYAAAIAGAVIARHDRLDAKGTTAFAPVNVAQEINKLVDAILAGEAP